MAAVSPELEKELLKTELEQEQRAASKAGIRAKEGKERELNDQENAALVAYVNRLLAGRDAWLKQMREIQTQAKRRELTAQEENALNDQVRQLLRDRPNFFAEFKYEPNNDAPNGDPSNTTGFDGVLKTMFSKISSAFGDGPFGFIGKLFEKILGFIFPMITAFKEMDETSNKKTANDLIKKDSFGPANVELESQEQAKKKQHRQLGETINAADPHSPEVQILKARMEAIETDMRELAAKRRAAEEQEAAFVREAVAEGGINAGIANMYANQNHAAKLAREKCQQEGVVRQREQEFLHEQERRRARFRPQDLAEAEVVD